MEDEEDRASDSPSFWELMGWLLLALIVASTVALFLFARQAAEGHVA